MNKYIEYYSKKNVSPVKQDISDISGHIERRLALYRLLGVTPATLKGSRVLEVGPGSGYNSVVTASCKPAEYSLVEPNLTGYREMLELFGRFDFSGTRLSFNNVTLENFNEKPFDVVLCEGLIPGLDDKAGFLKKLTCFAEDKGSVLVITCIDTISIFFENARRYLAKKIIDKHGITDFDKQVDHLCVIFEKHLKTLKGVTRFTTDWVIDAILNPAAANHDFSFRDAMEVLRDDFFFLGASPDIFTNTVWYKNLPHDPKDYNNIYETQFAELWHNLIHYKISEQPREAEKNIKLFNICTEFNDAINKNIFENADNDGKIISLLSDAAENLSSAANVYEAIRQFTDILNSECFNADEMMQKYPLFCEAFGRGQQYFSFVRK
ncbi:class I SAM-dependent methyltransferase [Seleniivibrio woodruffii]|uniref:Methyltransferase family protein n=1 Tax=Seleniivibrio woodruffii TaxID=1078050 RepID=A0A4R1KC12_9BACT|nr:class I SAM-dependent methyltransferase [Seleniivibrio woodruffii]TCK61667.1 methyltransferase family protein [Seleniivibrio woodruffii]TVZ35218.1 methyltransferase family protein [Seleniivibrio woodruffii]